MLTRLSFLALLLIFIASSFKLPNFNLNATNLHIVYLICALAVLGDQESKVRKFFRKLGERLFATQNKK